jgi:hypothetical protein
MQLSQENGWQVKQISQKYRNPAHKPDGPHAIMALAKFEDDPDLVGFWDQGSARQPARHPLLSAH